MNSTAAFAHDDMSWMDPTTFDMAPALLRNLWESASHHDFTSRSGPSSIESSSAASRLLCLIGLLESLSLTLALESSY